MAKDILEVGTNEEDAVKAFLKFRSYPTDKQAFAIAFLNGMEFQKKISETEKSMENFDKNVADV